MTLEEDRCVHVILISNKKKNFEVVKADIFENPEKWGTRFSGRLQLEFVPLEYPPRTSWMRNMFRPCTTFRLFIPQVLPYDAIIYVDTDFIFLRSVEHLWSEMENFSDSAVASMAPRLLTRPPKRITPCP